MLLQIRSKERRRTVATQKRLAGIKPAKGLEFKGKFPARTKFVYLEPKRDGLRCIVYKGKCYTATGVRIVNAPLIEKALKRIPGTAKNFVFDGEIFYKSCDVTKGIVKTQTPGHKLGHKLQLFAFDLISKKEWDAKECKTPLKRRKVNLAIALTKLGVRCKDKAVRNAIQPCECAVSEPNEKALKKLFKQFVAQGFEGLMMKDPHSHYSFRKNRDWQKLKPYSESDLKIINVETGTGKNKNRLGKLTLAGVIDGVKVKTKCGGGFLDKQRDELWAMHKKGKLIGKIVEIEHEGLTKKNAVRFPQFRRIHPEKN